MVRELARMRSWSTPGEGVCTAVKVVSPRKTCALSPELGCARASVQGVAPSIRGDFQPRTPCPAAPPRPAHRARRSIISATDFTARLRDIFGINWTETVGQPRSRLLHPLYPFTQARRAVSTMLLCYVAVVVQIEVGFYWHTGLCDGENDAQSRFDMFVDGFFLLEIAMNFFTGIFIEGAYNDRLAAVAYKYASCDLWFDCLTSVPVATLEYLARERYCSDAAALEADDGAVRAEIQGVKLVRALKPLRLFKLLKLMRAPEALERIDRAMHALHVPVTIARLVNMFIRCALVVHTCSCIYWLVKESSSTDEEVADFLSNQNLNDFQRNELFDRYTVAFYFVSVIFSTVGFGDVAAINTSERWIVTFFLYVGVIVFGAMLSEVQNPIADIYHVEIGHATVMNEVKAFLDAADAPSGLRKSILLWLDLDFKHQQRMKQQQEVIMYIPEQMRPALIEHLHKNASLFRIPFVRDLRSKDTKDFVHSLFASMTPYTALPGTLLINRFSKPDRLHILVQGSLNVKLYDASSFREPSGSFPEASGSFPEASGTFLKVPGSYWKLAEAAGRFRKVQEAAGGFQAATVSTLHIGDHFGFLGLVSEDPCYLTGKFAS